MLVGDPDLLRCRQGDAPRSVRKLAMEEYGAAYAAEGLVTLAGSRLYTSMADTDEVVDDALGRFERVLQQADLPAGGGAR